MFDLVKHQWWKKQANMCSFMKAATIKQSSLKLFVNKYKNKKVIDLEKHLGFESLCRCCVRGYTVQYCRLNYNFLQLTVTEYIGKELTLSFLFNTCATSVSRSRACFV